MLRIASCFASGFRPWGALSHSLLLGAALWLAPRPGCAQAPAPAGTNLHYRVVNATGRFADRDCFWSLDAGAHWHSLADEPRVDCPRGNGRLYFRLGPAPRDFADRDALWGFIEYASENNTTWHGNTTQVDAFCLPITIAMDGHRVGLAGGRAALFADFRRRAPGPFQSCLRGDQWIVAPGAAAFAADQPAAHYFDNYINSVWAKYAAGGLTPSGKWRGSVDAQGALTFRPVQSGPTYVCAAKPSTQDAFLGTGVLATNAPFCAAINRHVLDDPDNWARPAAFYQADPCNWYAKILHEHTLDHHAYGFCYDDVAEQAAFFSGHGSEVLVTLHWDKPAAIK